MKIDKKKIVLISKFVGLGIIAAGICILTYMVIGSFYGWTLQPLFLDASGGTSRSFGFMVVGSVLSAFLLIAVAGLVSYIIFVIVRPMKKAKLPAKTETEDENPNP
jgi:hypothetical protein